MILLMEKNYKMKTFEKLKMIGIENGKDILNKKIENLAKFPELQLRNAKNPVNSLKKSKKYGINLNYGGNEYGDKTANGFNITK